MEFTIHGYRFRRVPEYKERLLSLNHQIEMRSEFEQKPNPGKHAITASVDLPETHDPAVLSWSSKEETAFYDILFLLSLFTGRVS